MSIQPQPLRTSSSYTTLHAISGEYDFIAEIEAPDPEALNELIDDIGMLDGVARTTSSIILATKVQR